MSEVYHPSHYLQEHWPRIKARCGKPPEFSLSSLPEINKVVWGFQRQKMVVVGSRPGNGKSLLQLQLAYDFASQGHTVYFFSFEMSYGVCCERLLANHCEIDNFWLTNGKVAQIPTAESRVRKFIADMEGYNFALFESVGRTLPDFNRILHEIHGTPDVVFIDYGNLVQEVRGKSKKEAYDEYIKGLRALALKHNFCVVLGAQINRQVAHKGYVREPILEDLKDTGELEQTADQVLLLHYPYHHTQDPDDQGKYVIKIAKNRDGRTGRRECTIYPQYCKVVDHAKPTIE